MSDRDLVRVTMCDEKGHLDKVRHTRIIFAWLRAFLGEGAMESAPSIHAMVRSLFRKGKFSSQSHNPAASLMVQRGFCLNRERHIVGRIPGVSVGDAFLYQAELVVLGLHRCFQGGISYAKSTSSSTEPGESVATSIIVSGGYEDNLDDSDKLIYSGEGGRHSILNKQVADQCLEGGNLALKNSMEYGIEVRVFRGIKAGVQHKVIYIYDGLYKVESCKAEQGKSGFVVYKFALRRLPGQGALPSMKLKADLLALRNGNFHDLSNGLERLPIGFYNDVDDSVYPLRFAYLRQPVYPAAVFQWKFGGCSCTGGCSAAAGPRCRCVWWNGGELPYDKSGVLLHGKPLVYECGPHCGCPPTCANRVSQKGITSRLQVFRSRETGSWGVRSLDFIRAGTFVCELTGRAIAVPETRQRRHLEKMAATGLDEISDPVLMFPGMLPPSWAKWGNNISGVIPRYKPPVVMGVPDVRCFVMDMTVGRNVGCYLSDSPNPNVFAQFVLFDHYNLAWPHVMIFALEDIPPLKELGLDYGYGKRIL
ncbi:hypothetical protein ACP70R_018887 [Stipagrostis hirtigluma subsp. patula]